MKYRSALFFLSASTLVLAFIVVMVVLKVVVVPHIQQQAHVGTVCTVDNIITIEHGTENCDHAKLNNSLSQNASMKYLMGTEEHVNASGYDEDCTVGTCVQVNVLYTSISGNDRVGYLRPKQHEKTDVISPHPKVIVYGNLGLIPQREEINSSKLHVWCKIHVIIHNEVSCNYRWG